MEVDLGVPRLPTVRPPPGALGPCARRFALLLDAAITVDHYDVEGLAEAMRRVLADRDLAEALRRRGLERAKMFSWKKAARETMQVYEKVLRWKR